MIERNNDPKGCELCQRITGVCCVRPYTLQTPALARIAINEKGHQFLIEGKPIGSCILRNKMLNDVDDKIVTLLAVNFLQEQMRKSS